MLKVLKWLARKATLLLCNIFLGIFLIVIVKFEKYVKSTRVFDITKDEKRF